MPNDEMRNDKLRLTLVCHLSFFILGFVLRLSSLGRYVTPDEPFWVYRSIRFADALAARDWSAVPSTGHPGVTTMWLGAAGVAARRLLDPAESGVHLEWVRRMAWLAPENGEAFRHLVFFLPCGRVAVAFVTSLALLVVYWLAARLFGRRVALVTVGLLAFDPFLVGHSGLLHTDALLATFCLLALLAAFNGLRGPRPVLWWFLAGFFGSLAVLSKTPGVVVLVFLLGVLLYRVSLAVYRLSRRGSPPAAKSDARCTIDDARLAMSLPCFLAAAVLTFLAFYPAAWAGPLEVLQSVREFAGQHMAGAQRPIFFLGRMTYDPGPAFYPLVFLFRVSPVVLAGLVLGLVRLRRLSHGRQFVFLTLLAFAVLFGAVMSLGAKQHDRYLLPAFPPLALAAAISLSGIAKPTVWNLRHLVPVVLQLFLLLPFAVYPLIFFNPLLGGPPVAARVLQVGWGEGMGAAARWLNQLPQADRLTVAAVSVPSFAPLFDGHTVPLDQSPLADYLVLGPTHPTDQLTTHPAYTTFLSVAVVLTNTDSFEQAAYLTARAGPDDLILLDADTPLLRRYDGPGVLLSAASLPDEAAVAEWLSELVDGRSSIWMVASPGASPIAAAHLRRQVEVIATPVSTATVASTTVTRFALRPIPLDTSPLPYRALFGGQLGLVDGLFPGNAAWPEPLRLTMRWQALVAPSADYRTVAVLRDGQGLAWSTADLLVLNEVMFPTSAWAEAAWADAACKLPLPAGIPPDDYTVEVGLYDAATGAGLGAGRPDGAFLGTRVVVGEVTVAPPAHAASLAALGMPWQLNLSAGPLTLLGLEPPPAQVLSGDYLPLPLFWQADSAPGADYHVRLCLVGSTGEVNLEAAFPLSPYPTSRWQEGDRFQSRYRLHIPPGLPPGPYTLSLNVLQAGGGALWEVDEDIGVVEVLPRERSFDLPPDIPSPLDLTYGGVARLRGYGLAQKEVAPGEMLQLTLYWQAEGPTDRDYTLFVHLLGPDGLSYGQVDRVPGGGMAPTSSWATGQVIVEEFALPVPATALPGVYRLAVGLYDAAYGGRLPVADAAGQPLPDDQAVLPVVIGDSQ